MFLEVERLRGAVGFKCLIPITEPSIERADVCIEVGTIPGSERLGRRFDLAVDIRQVGAKRTLYRAKIFNRNSSEISAKQFVRQVIKVLLFTKLPNSNTTSV